MQLSFKFVIFVEIQIYMKVIYTITNLLNNKKYIGSSSNMEKRKNKHLYLLKSNKHHSLSLQHSWNKNKPENYIFEIIETLSENQNMYEIEQYYLDLYKTYDKEYGYNMSKNAIAPFGTNPQIKVVYQFSLEGLFLEKYDNCTIASNKYNIDTSGLSKCAREKYRFYGGYIWSYSKILSEERIAKANSPIKKSIETLRKMKENRKYTGKKAIVQLDLDGDFIKRFDSILEASKELNISHGGLCDACKSKTNKIKNYLFKYEKEYNDEIINR